MQASAFPTLELIDVRKVFGLQPALRGVSCTLRAGAVSLLMGPNGAGKSTLLSVLSTLSRPTSGHVRFGQYDHRYVEQHLRGRIGFVAHHPMLYDRLSSRENLLFFARLQGTPAPAETVSRWLAQLGLGRAADQPVNQLSKGMLQRVALVRALLAQPDLLLLDEPFSGLDREATSLLRDELQAVAAAGKIVLLVTHDAHAVDGLCDQLLVLKRGRVVLDHAAPKLGATEIHRHYHALC